MAPDVFISYARGDASAGAGELKRLFDEHDISSYMDVADPLPPGAALPREIERILSGSRTLVCLLSNGYGSSSWTQAEYAMARRLEKKIVPVIIGSRQDIGWLDTKDIEWFDRGTVVIVISPLERDGAVARATLIASTSPAAFIIAEADAVAARSPAAAIELIDQRLPTSGLRGLQHNHVLAHKAHLLRLKGAREEARKIVDSMTLDPDSPLSIVQTVLMTAARLRIDLGDYDVARARLAEAAAVLGRRTAWNTEDLQRRRFLAEVTRETARTLLDESYPTDPFTEKDCLALDLSWAIYMEALSLVTETEDLLGHAWVHENLGSLTTLYAKKTAGWRAASIDSQIVRLDYPAVSQLRGRTATLLQQSYERFEHAARLFKRVDDEVKRREGEAWTAYHRFQADQFAGGDESAAGKRSAIDKLRGIASQFHGIAEGEGLAYAEMFYLANALGEFDEAKEYGRTAVRQIRLSEKHASMAADIRAKAKDLGGLTW